ncbi:unnamed protein product [Caretta caretta]
MPPRNGNASRRNFGLVDTGADVTVIRDLEWPDRYGFQLGHCRKLVVEGEGKLVVVSYRKKERFYSTFPGGTAYPG